MLDVQDKEFLQVADEALASAWDQYHAAPDSEKLVLYSQVKLAFDKVQAIRMKLLEPATLTTAQDVQQARRLKDQIDSAADNQQLVMALVRFIALVTKF